MRSKALNWLEAGASVVLVLHPRTRSATVYRAGGYIQTLIDGTLDLSDAVPDWRAAITDFFV